MRYLCNIFLAVLVILLYAIPAGGFGDYPESDSTGLASRKASLELLLKVLPPDMQYKGSGFDDRGTVSIYDSTFSDWLERTGELPPDFEKMPSIPFLPDPLVIDEGGRNITVKSMSQWEEKRDWMKEQLQKYVSGTFPPPPDNLKATILEEKTDGQVKLRLVELSFGPDHRAKLTMEVMIPPGEGPFPVFLTQWNHREWAQVAVRRGYMGCIYAGADSKDDTEKYAEIWAGQYDFTRLMRRAWGASRAIDYLVQLPETDTAKIAITGHSRNGKTSLMAAAFDDRITACIPGSGGTGAEVPWRYCSWDYDIEDIPLLATARPSWLHPRLRFFSGREHKLPVDQNSFMALIAPRGLMLSTAINEGASNPWGIEQAFLASRKVYDFLGATDKMAIRSRYGLHSISARDMEEYLDFFDYVFGRSHHQPANKLFFFYSFDEWKKISGENINPDDLPSVGTDLVNGSGNTSATTDGWEKQKSRIRENVRWLLGNEPPGVTNPGPRTIRNAGRGEEGVGTFLTRPAETKTMGLMPISPYNGFGDQLFGYLYYPLNGQGKMLKDNLPVVIWLHEYDYSKGFSSYHQVENLFKQITALGFAVFAFDQLGFGNRIEEASRFYQRYPHWSKMGKMVTDVRGALDALTNLDFIDENCIIVAGHALGGTVGLFSAALDDRISGVISVAGFTPMRTNTANRGTEGILKYSHLHGLIPRLGFFVGKESKIPVDFPEIIASLSPRKVLVIAPRYDRDAHVVDIEKSMYKVREIFALHNKPENLELSVPDDFNRLSFGMKDEIMEWLKKFDR